MTVKTDVIQSIDPSDETVIEEVPVTEPDRVDDLVSNAIDSQISWRREPLDKRIDLLLSTADRIEENQDDLSKTLTREQGKPLEESESEISKTVHRIRFFCEQASNQLSPEVIEVDDSVTGEVHYRPYGLVGAIKPWNFPVNLPTWTLVPALLAGNTVIFKPSELTPVIGRKLIECFPEELHQNNVINLIQGGGEVGRKIVQNSQVNYVSFIGSRETGEWIYRASAEHLRPVSLELGGKDPMIILEDADLEESVTDLLHGAYKNCGQVCCGIERCLVHESIYDQFLESLTSAVKNLVVGNGFDDETDLGPMIRNTERDRVREHLRQAEENGANIIYSKNLPDTEKGFWQAPAVVTDVDRDMKIMNEETFGPVVTVQPFEAVDEAIDEANRLDYGLSASIYTQDSEVARNVSRQIDAGSIGINQTVGSIGELPWGGVKKSGLGRLLGEESLRTFTQSVTERWNPNER